MGIEFDWQVSEEHAPDPPTRGDRRRSPTRWLLLAALLVAAGALFWRWRSAETALAARVQEVVTLQSAALAAGDGELFFSFLTADAAWKAAQLQPRVQALYRPPPVVVAATQRGARVRATLRQTIDGQTLDRVAFFVQTADGLQSVPGDPDFWGSARAVAETWGVLTLTAADEAWRDAIAATVAAGGYQGNVVIRSDYRQTAVPNQFVFPSPHLLGIGPDDAIDPYLAQLADALSKTQMTPILRFGVPLAYQARFEQLAAEYAATADGRPVEIVPLEILSISEEAVLATLDGLYLTPTAAQLARGQILDLTDFALSDPAFASDDIHAALLAGGIWRDRLWLYPHSADVRLLFYDLNGWPIVTQPTAWTWSEFAAQLAIAAETTGRGGLLTAGLDPLFAYAYGTPAGAGELDALAAAQALNWYNHLPAKVDLSGEPDANARELAVLRRLSSRRQVNAWFERPTQYEYHALLGPVGVMPYPAADLREPVTPLTVRGSVITSAAPSPLAVWHWLNFLSYQVLDQAERTIPVRRSVAERTDYWGGLPRALRGPLENGFANGRAITIDDRRLIRWDGVADVLAGRQTATQATQTPPLRWFLPQTLQSAP